MGHVLPAITSVIGLAVMGCRQPIAAERPTVSDVETAQLKAATAKACADMATDDVAMQTLADEIKQSKARRGASPTDPFTDEEARIFADMKLLFEKSQRCAAASNREVAHAKESQSRAVHAYVDDLKRSTPPAK